MKRETNVTANNLETVRNGLQSSVTVTDRDREKNLLSGGSPNPKKPKPFFELL